MKSLINLIEQQIMLRKDILFGPNLRIFKIFVVDYNEKTAPFPISLLNLKIKPTVSILLERMLLFKTFLVCHDLLAFVVYPAILVYCYAQLTLAVFMLVFAASPMVFGVLRALNFFLEQKTRMPPFYPHKNGDTFSGIEKEDILVDDRHDILSNKTKAWYPSKYHYFLVTDTAEGNAIDLQQDREVKIYYKML